MQLWWAYEAFKKNCTDLKHVNVVVYNLQKKTPNAKITYIAKSEWSLYAKGSWNPAFQH